VVHPFPIDADLPTLVGATDRAVAAEVIGNGWGDCSVVLGHYGRRHRCVLRYEGHLDASRAPVYGKVYADDRGASIGPVLAALAERAADEVVAPRFVGYRPDLRLSLLEELPGRRERVDALVDDAAYIAAALHGSGIDLGVGRSLDDELRELDALLGLMQPVSPGLAATLRRGLKTITSAAVATQPLAPVFSHGDFTHSQLLTGDGRPGLVDFDSIAQAEPALDLGQFLAYLRLGMAQADGVGAKPRADRVAQRFFWSYVEASAPSVPLSALRRRVQVHEAISLMRTTVHAWQKLKPARLQSVFPILVEQVSCLD
jgi:hypothetical protein